MVVSINILLQKDMAEAESNKLKFTKMHAFGNDFVIFDFRITPEKQFTESDLILTCDRNFGIGCDQLITIHKSATPDDEKGTNVMIKVYNNDGSVAENCGNGIRCVAGFVAKENTKPLVRVQLGNKITLVKVDRENEFAKANMGTPIINGDIVDLGNKHKIIIVDNFDNMDFTPNPDYNVHYVQVRSRTEVFMRTIERGVGETMSCGSGTCAVAGYCIKNNLTDKVMKVTSRGSDIMDTSAEISWDGEGKPMLLGGNYSFVFTGEIEI